MKLFVACQARLARNNRLHLVGDDVGSLMDILRKTLTKDEKIIILCLAMNLRGCTIITSSKKKGGGCPQNDNTLITDYMQCKILETKPKN